MTQKRTIHFLSLIVTLAWMAAVTAPSAGATSFTVPASYPAGMGPHSLAVADINGDGKADVVTANDDGARVLLGDGRGRLTAPVSVPADFFMDTVAVADLNADGNQDLVLIGLYADLEVLLGDGSGGFTVASRYPGVGRPPVIGDFNGDGVLDIVTSQSLLYGEGDGDFSPGETPILGMYFATADFNGDGDIDLVVTDQEEERGDLRILLGDGAGHFTQAGVYDARMEPQKVMVGDLNGDGDQDVVAQESQCGDYDLMVLLGDGTGTFTVRRSQGLVARDASISMLGDFDGDGRLDVAGSCYRGILVVRGDGRGGFLSPERLSGLRGSWQQAAADFNNDGLLDIAAVDFAHDAVSVYLNGPRLAPAVMSLSPARGRIGDIVTLVGAHFGSRRGAGVVRFGGLTATDYVSWSATKIRVRVPDDTTKGLVKVHVLTVAGGSEPRTFLRL
jgi:hypothetical protein